MSTAIQCGNVEEIVRITESLAFNGGGAREAAYEISGTRNANLAPLVSRRPH